MEIRGIPTDFMGITNTREMVSCLDCEKQWMKRSDSIKHWSGRCKGCASKEVAQRPAMIEHYKKLGKAMTEKYGGIPNAVKFTSEKVRGANNHNWRGGITPLVMKIRNSFEYKTWRLTVFRRDNFTCQMCGQRGGKLHADHIKPFAFFPELRLDLNNGRTLCIPCHKTTDTYLNKAKSYATA